MKAAALLILWSSLAYAQDGYTLTPADGPFQFDVRPSLEAVVWSGDTPAPALVDLKSDALFAPAFSLAMDASAGDRWFMHATTRWDRGFDAGAEPDGEVRLDEILLRWRPSDDQRLNFQIGKFATAFGAWSPGHDFFDDPFLLAPLPYSQIIGINSRNPAANSPAAIGDRSNGSAPAVSTLSKDQWASTIWGPSYATGASVFGASDHFDYALEMKSAALSSHPDSWNEVDFDDPTVTGRLGYRPDAAWAFGVSASRGPWMDPDVSGVDRGDFMQSAVGMDLRWAHRDLIISGEVILSEFETPAAGDLRTASCFIQGRWKVSPGFWLAARFGQMVANDANGDVPWQPDVQRAEIGAGWRITQNLLLKTGYSYTHTDGDSEAGNHLLGTGLGWRF